MKHNIPLAVPAKKRPLELVPIPISLQDNN